MMIEATSSSEMPTIIYQPVEMATYPKIPESLSTVLCGEFSSMNILNG
jgi:hypothetical protein